VLAQQPKHLVEPPSFQIVTRSRGRQLMGWMAPWRHRRAKMVVVKDHQQREPSMGDITTIGLDLAKNVFQVHAVDVAGSVVLRKRLRRGQVLAFFAGLPPCLIDLEACATAHHWARELIALGHETRLMPPSYVKAYVKRNKHDVADAEAICEAVRRPSMRFVPLKTAEQQSALMMHRARDLLIRQRTMLVNALRGHLAEFGLVEAQGLHKMARLIAIVMDEMDARVPDIARQVLKMIVSQIEEIQTRIAGLETQVLAWHKSNPISQRLATIPGIGPIIATAVAATVADPNTFRSGREFAAWLGLVPRQNSTGGKARLGGISKRGDSYLRRLLVNSAHTVLLCSKAAKADPWLTSLLSRKPRLVVAVALANKMARMAWAIMSRPDLYRHAAVAA
jgi:transposase